MVRPFIFPARTVWGARGVALCGARGFAAPAAGAKRKDNLRFSFLFELLPFPYFLIWRRPETGDRSEKGNGRGFFLSPGRALRAMYPHIRSVRYHTATHTGYSA